MIVLVTGGRDIVHEKRIHSVLDAYHAEHPITLLIHGGAAGADLLANMWATKNEVNCLRVPAKWKKYGGKSAGPRRNHEMLNLGYVKPDICFAFPTGGPGTANMITQCCGIVEVRVIE